MLKTKDEGLPVLPQTVKTWKKKVQSAPRGTKISEFNKIKSEQKTLKLNQLELDQLVLENSAKKSKPETKKSKSKELPIAQNVDVQPLQSTSSNENEVIAKTVKETQNDKLRKKYLDEALTERKDVARKYFTMFKDLKLNEKAHLDLNNYPMFSHEMLSSNLKNEFYDDSELELSNKALFYVPDGYDMKKLQLPSVTRVLNVAKPIHMLNGLINWKIDKVEKLGEVGFQIYKKDLLARGKLFHDIIEKTLKKEPVQQLDENHKLFKCIQRANELIQKEFKEFVSAETSFSHKNLFYQGRVDLLANYKDSLCLIDWKRKDELKEKEIKDLFDEPIQVAAYLGGLYNNSMPNGEVNFSTSKIKNILIIHIDEKGESNIYCLNYSQIEFYWRYWLEYLKQFWSFVHKEYSQYSENKFDDGLKK